MQRPEGLALGRPGRDEDPPFALFGPLGCAPGAVAFCSLVGNMRRLSAISPSDDKNTAALLLGALRNDLVLHLGACDPLFDLGWVRHPLRPAPADSGPCFSR